jgi:hypothetical protein
MTAALCRVWKLCSAAVQYLYGKQQGRVGSSSTKRTPVHARHIQTSEAAQTLPSVKMQLKKTTCQLLRTLTASSSYLQLQVATSLSMLHFADRSLQQLHPFSCCCMPDRSLAGPCSVPVKMSQKLPDSAPAGETADVID